MSCKTTFFCAIYRTFVEMKKVIVMGASSGMGQALATLLYKDGWKVGVAARRIEEMEQWKLAQQQLNPNRSLEKASCHFLMTAIRKTALYILDP